MTAEVKHAAGFRTARARVGGLGASHTGSHGFIVERVTSIALVPLCLWAAWAAVTVAPTGYEGAVAFLRSPWHAALAVLLVAVGLRHAAIGMRVIVEDYVQHHGARIAWLLVNSAVAWIATAVAVVSILKVAFSA